MNRSCVFVLVSLMVFCVFPTLAESHRATRLGNPATRFAPPISTPEELRSRFADPKLRPDFAAVLDQWGWTGNIDDMFGAAATAEVSDIKIAVGHTMPFMSTRENGKAICLRNVTWAGKEPAPAYAFNFTSKGRRYRCVTPKACSNFFLEDHGAPALTITCEAQEQSLAGRQAKVCFTLRNSGDAVERNIAVELLTPKGADYVNAAGEKLSATEKLTWQFPELAPGQAKLFCASFLQRQPGAMRFNLQVRGELSGLKESLCETAVAGVPAILLEVIDVEDPIEVGKEVIYDIKVTNQGSAPGTNIRMVATLPDGQEFVSGSGVTKVSADGKTLTVEPLATLAPKAEAAWRVQVKATQAGDTRFKVLLSSDQFAEPIEEGEATQQY